MVAIPNQIPSSQMLTCKDDIPETVASVDVFLVSDESRSITGPGQHRQRRDAHVGGVHN
jgi:hypothetical protein